MVFAFLSLLSNRGESLPVLSRPDPPGGDLPQERDLRCSTACQPSHSRPPWSWRRPAPRAYILLRRAPSTAPRRHPPSHFHGRTRPPVSIPGGPTSPPRGGTTHGRNGSQHGNDGSRSLVGDHGSRPVAALFADLKRRTG